MPRLLRVISDEGDLFFLFQLKFRCNGWGKAPPSG